MLHKISFIFHKMTINFIISFSLLKQCFLTNHYNLNTHPDGIKINAAEGLYNIIMRYVVQCSAIHRELVPHLLLKHSHCVWQ